MNITVSGLPALAPTQHVYITGALPELGAGQTAPSAALGPMLTPDNQSHRRTLLVSLPACQTTTLRFELVDLSGQIIAEPGAHTLKIPCQGEGGASLIWGG